MRHVSVSLRVAKKTHLTHLLYLNFRNLLICKVFYRGIRGELVGELG